MRKLAHRQLLAVNYANDYTLVKEPHPAVSVLNFHYSFPPAVVPLNWSLNKPICFDETSGGDMVLERRREAWAFLLSGGRCIITLIPALPPTTPPAAAKFSSPTAGLMAARCANSCESCANLWKAWISF